MATPTNYYCDYAAGNDYNGASFTDGSFAVATMTLTKAGAFSKSKVNHWLYLTDNGSGRVTPGYYKIASVTSVNAVVLATSPRSGAVDPVDVKCTQATGTSILPFRSVQGALDIITRDATNGDQININASTVQVSQAALTLTTYGTPTSVIPLVLRGYTSAANDGGVASMDANGATLLASAYSSIQFSDLIIYNFGNNSGVVVGNTCVFFHCQVHKGASSPSGKYLLNSTGNYVSVINCYIHDAGTNGTGVFIDGISTIRDNYFYNCPNGVRNSAEGFVDNNLFVDCATIGIQSTGNATICRNTIYSSTASTGKGISITGGFTKVYNNIIEGYSGVGGIGLFAAVDVVLWGYNSYYNCTTNHSTVDVYIDLSANDVTLTTSPFVNAAGGNFALKLPALEDALPGVWPGLATTVSKANRGAIQNGAGTGGAVMISPGRLGIG